MVFKPYTCDPLGIRANSKVLFLDLVICGVLKALENKCVFGMDEIS